MPKVPSYDNFQVAQTALPAGAVRAPEMPDVAGQQAQQMSQGLMRAGGTINQIMQAEQNKADQVRVDDALNMVTKARTDLQVEALKLRGRNALERPDNKSLADEYSEKFDEVTRNATKALGNDTQRAVFGQRVGQMRNQFYGSLSSHMVEQQGAFQNETWKSKIETAQNQAALLWGDAGMRAESAVTIASTVGEIAKAKGWDPATTEAALRDAMSPVHVGVMNGMIKSGSAADAKLYYEANSAGMSIQARATMQGVIKEANDTQTAEANADAVWAKSGPKLSNDAVKIFDMEAELRAQLKDNPDAMKIGLSALRQRAQAFNAQQTENNAKGINDVFGLIDSGTPMSQVRRSDAWLALPAAKRHDITKALEAEANVRMQHSAAASARELSELQRRDKLALLHNGDAFLSYSDPAKLATMSRNEVAALRTTFGMDGVQHLLNRWDGLQKQEGKLEARIDQDTFNQVADEMGLKPFESKKSATDREALGSLKYRVETLIDVAQSKKGSALSRSEKEELIRGEMTRTVTVDPGMFSRNVDKPVIALTPEQAKRVVVPNTDRQQIVAALKSMYASQPNNPLYAPTEANVRRLYLTNKSRAGTLINGQ